MSGGGAPPGGAPPPGCHHKNASIHGMCASIHAHSPVTSTVYQLP